MPDEGPTCSQCGCELEGRDVFEGTCKACREEQILGKAVASAKSARAAPAPPPVTTRVTTDEDTKAMEPVEGSLDDGPTAPLPESDTKASEPLADAAQDEAPPLDLSGDAGPPSPAPRPKGKGAQPPAPSPEPASPPSPGQLPSELPTLEGEPLAVLPGDVQPAEAPRPASKAAPVLSLKGHPRSHEAPAAPLPADKPEAHKGGAAEGRFVFPLKMPPGLQEPGDEPERPTPAATPKLSAPPTSIEPPARLEPPARAAPPGGELALENDDLHARDEPETPSGGRPAPQRPAAAADGARPLGLAPARADEVIRQAIERVDQRVQELAVTVAAALRSGPGGHSIGSGFRFCVGLVLGLGVLSALVVGGMYAVGKYLHPPTLELLERLLRTVTGG